MSFKLDYILLALLGAGIPLSQFLPFLFEQGLDFGLMAELVFINRISAFLALDVIISAVVLIICIIHQQSKRTIRYWWIPVIGSHTVGVSYGLPLFLYLNSKSN
jgi:hypothetical protein